MKLKPLPPQQASNFAKKDSKSYLHELFRNKSTPIILSYKENFENERNENYLTDRL